PYAAGELLLFEGAWDQAATKLGEAWDRGADDLRQKIRHRYLFAAYKAGRELEAYQKVAPRQDTFFQLANLMTMDRQGRELGALVQEHGKTGPASAWQHFFTGEWHLLRGDAGQAEQSFAAALANAPAMYDWQFRDGLFRARLKLGKAVATYREFGPNSRTF